MINLNADMGESFGAYEMGDDQALLGSVTSANIACGFHGGDPVVMTNTVKMAVENNVSIGAHPSFPDLQGFGRRVMKLSADEVYAMTVYQIGALMGIAQTQGAKVTHVKPHGALNNMACEDADLADTLAKSVKDVDRDLIFLAPALSELSNAGQKAGLAVANEIFADRAYTEKGTLVNRREQGAVIHDASECLSRVVEMLEKGGLVSQSGSVLKTDIHSICVHGDSPKAVDAASFIKAGLIDKGFDLVGLDKMTL